MKKKIPEFLTYALVLGEALLCTKFIGIFGVYLTPVVLFIIGAGISTTSLWRSDHLVISGKKYRVPGSVIMLLVLLGLNVFVFYNTIGDTMVSLSTSDIIPNIHNFYLERFFNGSDIYAPLIGITGEPTPNYLTFHWLPFAISRIFNFDHRWISMSTLLLVLGIIFIYRIKTREKKIHDLLNIGVIFGIILLYQLSLPVMFAHTIEPLMAAYYVILAYGILKKNLPLIISGVILVCLSRYSVIFFLPFLFVNELIHDRKKFIILSVSVVVGVIVLYLLPFLKFRFYLIFEGLKWYDQAAMGEWSGQSWQQAGDKPFQLFRGLGFVGWFYDHLNGSVLEKFHIYKKIFLIISSIAGLLPLVFIRQLNKIIPDRGILNLMVLKFYLTVFYSFVVVPYVYLYFVPVMVSCVLLLAGPARRIRGTTPPG